jgi:hypothetical protein
MNPPTRKQLERVHELIGHPAVTPYLDNLMNTLPWKLMTDEETERLIQWMKVKVAKYDVTHQ